VNIKIFLNFFRIPHFYRQILFLTHVVTTAMELKFNAETGGRLADQEIYTFLCKYKDH
jgi:hypothetical protein